jgi:hypothetical protein
MDPAKEPTVPEHPPEDQRSDHREDPLPQDSAAALPQDSGNLSNPNVVTQHVEKPSTGDSGVQSTQEPQLSLDWSHLSSSEMAYMTHGDYEGDLDDSLIDRPKTPIRQYLIDVIGEKNVCELEAVDGNDEDTDDEFRQACAVMSETDTDFVSSNLGTDRKENPGQLFSDKNKENRPCPLLRRNSRLWV